MKSQNNPSPITHQTLRTTPYLIQGDSFSDSRGIISFVNDFDFSDVKRFYTIQNKSTKIIRAWQGHKVENKYFFVTSGSFLICCVEIDDWKNPSKNLPVKKFILSADESQILLVSAGNATGIKSLKENSKLLVFSSSKLEDSSNDEYRFDTNMWMNWGNI